jgi:mono/diheme cytochrome c family protein
MDLWHLLSRVLRSRWFSFSAICLGLGLILLVPTHQQLSHYGTTASFNAQTNPTPTPFRNSTATPPTQGGHGKDVFYLHCMPCHGDLGQGLTDEFRFREYPPEDTNCWKSGCHGERPYENGFTLPKTIPALIGPSTLSHFTTAQDVYNFIHKAMPFNAPGSLSDEEYLQLLAFLLESNHIVSEGTRLDAVSLANIALHGNMLAPTAASNSSDQPSAANGSLLIGVLVFLFAATILSLVTRPRRPRSG